MDTFPGVLPSYSTAKSAKIKVRRADFGDGYSQRSPQGLNPLGEQWSVVFEKRAVAVCDQIEAFLEAHDGAAAFWWTAPREQTPKKWTCAEWSRTPAEAGYDTIRCTFVREYDL